MADSYKTSLQHEKKVHAAWKNAWLILTKLPCSMKKKSMQHGKNSNAAWKKSMQVVIFFLPDPQLLIVFLLMCLPKLLNLHWGKKAVR